MKIFNSTLLLSILLLSTNLYSKEKLRIAVVQSYSTQAYNEAAEGFKGYLEQKNINVFLQEHLLYGRKDVGSEVCRKIIKMEPDIVFTIGTLATKIVSEKIKEVPIVFNMVLDTGFIQNKADVSGVLMNISMEMKIKALKRLNPKAQKIGFLHSPRMKELAEKLSSSAKKAGLECVYKEILFAKDLPAAFEEVSWQIDAFIIIPDSNIYTVYSTKHIIMRCIQNKIALVGLSSSYTEIGALFSLDRDYVDMGKQSGEIVYKWYQGASLEDMPFEFPRVSKLSVNLKIADEINVVIPQHIIKEAAWVYEE